MSSASTIAENVRSRLLTPPAQGELPTSVDLTRIDVIIDRQKPILSMIDAAVAKATGTAIVILWSGFRIPDKNTRSPRLEQRYTITVYSRQVIDGENRPADNVIESIVNRLWHWVPDGGHAYGEAEISGGDMIPDKQYLAYDCEVIIPSI
jgi:hypothetical protein